MLRELVTLLLVSALLTALAVYFTYPLAFNASDRLLDARDPVLTSYLIGHGVRALSTNPPGLFEGSFYYPYSSTIAFGEHLLTEAALAAPVIWLGGSAALANNISLLLALVLSGLGAFLLARELTGRAEAALLAGVIFAFTNFRLLTLHHLQVQWIAPLPFALFWLHSYLRRGRATDLLLMSAALLAQVLASLYYALFSFLLVGLMLVSMLLLRAPEVTRSKLARCGAALALVFVLTLPVHIPYVLTNMRYAADYSIAEAEGLSSDPQMYLTLHEANDSIVRPLLNSVFGDHRGGSFPGVVAVALAALALPAARRRREPGNGRLGLARKLCLALVALELGVVALACAANLLEVLIQPAQHAAAIAQPFVALPVLALAWTALAGFGRQNGAPDEDRESARRLTILYCMVALQFFFVSLGPHVSIGRVDAGPGIHSLLYYLLPPLKAVRFVSRFAVLVLLAISVLAALGAARLFGRLRGRAAPAALAALMAAFMVYEYGTGPRQLVHLPAEPKPAYRWLARQQGSFAVLELPLHAEFAYEAERMYRSLQHGKRIVNGYTGFKPPLHKRIYFLAQHELTVPVLQFLRSIPFRYALVHEALEGQANRAMWQLLRSLPGSFEPVGWFGDTAVFRNLNSYSGRTILLNLPRAELASGRLRFEVRAADDEALDQRLAVSLDGRELAAVRINGSWREVLLEGIEPDGIGDVAQLRFTYSFESIADGEQPQRPFGSQVDIEAASACRRSGHLSQLEASVSINGSVLACPDAGYTLVVIDGGNGEVLARAGFNTASDPQAAERMASFIGGIEGGRLVAGITCFQAGRHIDDGVVRALRSLGCARAGELLEGAAGCHAFIGVKGAAPGSAAEATGAHTAGTRIGRDQGLLGFQIRNLEFTEPG